MTTHVYEVAVVGAGPIGLELAVALKREKIDYIHFDAKQVGYTISWFAPQTRFFSSNERIAIAGVPLMTADNGKATREEYLAYLRAVVRQFDLRINAYEPVIDIQKNAESFLIVTRPRGGEMKQYRARRVALVVGGTDQPNLINVPGEDLPQVSHYFQDPHQYFNQRLLVVGGKNSAVEAALRCHQAGAKVTCCHRGERFPAESIKYWLLPEINGYIQSGKIDAFFNTSVVKIAPDYVTLRRGDELFDVPADFVLLMTGYIQDCSLFRKIGIQLTGPQLAPDFNEATMETNIPGINVAGTAIAGTQSKYRVFIENCHVHVERIVRAIKGDSATAPQDVEFAQPES